MPRTKSPADQALSAIVKTEVAPPLRVLGFRKSGLNWVRRHGACVQVFNLQTSSGSTWTEKGVYINVALAFDAICALVDIPVLEKPKEYECDERGLRDRSTAFVPGAPARWQIAETMTRCPQLAEHVEQLAAGLAGIDGPTALRSHPWFTTLPRPSGWAAQILHLTGDTNAAHQEIDALCAQFSDRAPLNTSAHWLETLGLRS